MRKMNLIKVILIENQINLHKIKHLKSMHLVFKHKMIQMIKKTTTIKNQIIKNSKIKQEIFKKNLKLKSKN